MTEKKEKKAGQPGGFREKPAGNKPGKFKAGQGGRRTDGKPGGFRKGPAGGRNGGKPVRTEKRAPEKPAVEGMPARRLALKVIRQVTEQGAYASLALDTALNGCGLIAADRRLVSRLVYDTLDHLIYLDYVLGQVMEMSATEQLNGHTH